MRATVQIVRFAIAWVVLVLPSSLDAADLTSVGFALEAGLEISQAPDSARIDRVRLDLRHFDDVRIHSGGARLVSHGAVVSFDGLVVNRVIGRRGMTSPPPRERLVSWAEIDSIQARDGASGSGVLLGAVAGLAVGMSILLVDSIEHIYTLRRSEDTGGKTLLLGIAGGMALGWLIDRPGRWETVYP